MRKPPFTDLPSLLAWLGQLAPVDRIRVARLLADRTTTGALAQLADATVYEMTRTMSHRQAMRELGTTSRSIKRAITSHRERHPELEGITPP